MPKNTSKIIVPDKLLSQAVDAHIQTVREALGAMDMACVQLKDLCPGNPHAGTMLDLVGLKIVEVSALVRCAGAEVVAAESLKNQEAKNEKS